MPLKGRFTGHDTECVWETPETPISIEEAAKRVRERRKRQAIEREHARERRFKEDLELAREIHERLEGKDKPWTEAAFPKRDKTTS